MAVVPLPGVRVALAESLIRDYGIFSEWCDLWGMKLNASKTKTMILSRSRTMHPQSPPLTIVLLGVTFASKMTLILRSIFARFPEHLLKGLVS